MASLSGVPDPSLTWTRAAVESIDLKGRQVAVVGGTGGLGRALARLMAARGALVTVVGQTFRDAGTAGLIFVKADLSLMAEVRRVAAVLPAETLDLLVLTTGIFAAPERQVTAEKLERDMAVSYLSRFVLMQELAGRLGTARTTPGRTRVFVMGFPGAGNLGNPDDQNAEQSYAPTPVHMNTVAGNEALVIDLAQKHKHFDVFGLNPGLIKTDIRANFLGAGSVRHRLVETLIGLVMMSAERYAERTLPLLVAPELDGRSGALFNQKGKAILPSEGMTADYAARFMAASKRLVG